MKTKHDKIVEILESHIETYAFDNMSVNVIHPDDIPKIATAIGSLDEQEAKERYKALLWWMNQYFERGTRQNKDGKLELNWSNKEEACQEWNKNEAPLYTADELVEKFISDLKLKQNEKSHT